MGLIVVQLYCTLANNLLLHAPLFFFNIYILYIHIYFLISYMPIKQKIELLIGASVPLHAPPEVFGSVLSF